MGISRRKLLGLSSFVFRTSDPSSPAWVFLREIFSAYLSSSSSSSASSSSSSLSSVVRTSTRSSPVQVFLREISSVCRRLSSSLVRTSDQSSPVRVFLRETSSVCLSSSVVVLRPHFRSIRTIPAPDLLSSSACFVGISQGKNPRSVCRLSSAPSLIFSSDQRDGDLNPNLRRFYITDFDSITQNYESLRSLDLGFRRFCHSQKMSL